MSSLNIWQNKTLRSPVIYGQMDDYNEVARRALFQEHKNTLMTVLMSSSICRRCYTLHGDVYITFSLGYLFILPYRQKNCKQKTIA